MKKQEIKKIFFSMSELKKMGFPEDAIRRTQFDVRRYSDAEGKRGSRYLLTVEEVLKHL